MTMEPAYGEEEEEEEEEEQDKVHFVGTIASVALLSRRWLNLIKVAYNPHRLDV